MPDTQTSQDQGRARGVDRPSARTLIALFVLTAPISLLLIGSLWLSPFALGWVLSIPGVVTTIAGLRGRPARERVGGRLALPSLVLLLMTATLQVMGGVISLYNS